MASAFALGKAFKPTIPAGMKGLRIDTNLYCYDQELAHYYVEVMEITKMENVNAILDGRAKNAVLDMMSAKQQIVQVSN